MADSTPLAITEQSRNGWVVEAAIPDGVRGPTNLTMPAWVPLDGYCGLPVSGKILEESGGPLERAVVHAVRQLPVVLREPCP